LTLREEIFLRMSLWKSADIS